VLAPSSTDGGYTMTSGLWGKAVLQPSAGPVTLIWKEVGSDTTPSGDRVVSGYFYADSGDFAYGSEFNPEVFVKIYITTGGWCNIAFNHVTVDNVSIFSAINYAGSASESGTASLNARLVEHPYDGVVIDEGGAPVTGKIPDTGQIASYTDTVGEDSDYTINPPSYTKLDASGNALPDSAAAWAMVRDNVTRLIWENKTENGDIHDQGNVYNSEDARNVFIARLNNEKFGGYSDWRLPTVMELSILINSAKGHPGPAINTSYFQPTSPSKYWSSTSLASDSKPGWYVDFYDGEVIVGDETSCYYVRAVRGETAQGSFVDNGDGTISHTKTGLMWQQAETALMTWEAALTYCESLNLANHNDWRLPNRNELQSIVDYSKNDPAIDTVVFPGAMATYYWSSTALAKYSLYAWSVYFGHGGVYRGRKSTECYVRAVRAGVE